MNIYQIREFLLLANDEGRIWSDDKMIGSHKRPEGPRDRNRRANVLEKQRAERDAQILAQTERLCAAEQARNNSVRMRLGLSVQGDPLPLPQPQARPRRRPDSSVQGGRIRSVKYLPPLNAEEVTEDQTFRTPRYQRSPETQDEEMEELCSGSTASTPVVVSRTKRPQTPGPLSAEEQPGRRVLRLPVFRGSSSRSLKEVAGGYRLQTAEDQLEIVEKVKNLVSNYAIYVPQPPAVPRHNAVESPFTSTPSLTPGRSDEVTPPDSPPTLRGNAAGRLFNPTPPPKPAHHPAIQYRVSQQPAETVKRISSLRAAVKERNLEERQPLPDPVKGLSLCLQLLGTDDWKNKTEGLQKVQALAQHNPDTLKVKLNEVCLAVIEEVQNLRSSVSTAAMETMVYLYVYLQKKMDLQAERTGHALLQKIAQSNANAFIRRQANTALEAMVENCSPGRVLITLMNKGLSHLSAAVRASTAQMFHLLADRMGADAIFSADKTFTHSFLTAVSKMSLDASAEVRSHGHAILQELSLHRHFSKLWINIVADRDRCLLQRVLRTARKV